ncbi:type II secretion system protein J [Mesorhizobium sp. UC22_110]|uniref:PulJ/GspJ family protein n=1 Tax=unclassified Mesorhizobium TaxID=325217 RepID=UPI00366B4695
MTRDGEAGFTVLETLVAMTILALTLAIASQSIVLAARSLAAARNQTNAMLRIRGQLTGLETSGPLASAQSGEGWSLQEIDVGGKKLAAVRIAGSGASFLTFIPSRNDHRE